MKKALILIGAYVSATVSGGLLGAGIWPEPSRLSDLPGFLIMAPLFQFVAALCSLTCTAPGPDYSGANPVPPVLLFIALLLAVVSTIWYWRTRKKLALLAFGLSVVLLSLPGTNMLYAAIAI